jgi:hypothetical protein
MEDEYRSDLSFHERRLQTFDAAVKWKEAYDELQRKQLFEVLETINWSSVKRKIKKLQEKI